MGENAQKIGKKLEKFGVKLFEMFNWNKKMGDKEIKCTRGSHKNAQGRKNKRMESIYIWNMRIHI